MKQELAAYSLDKHTERITEFMIPYQKQKIHQIGFYRSSIQYFY